MSICSSCIGTLSSETQMRRLNTQKHRLRLLQHLKESTRTTPQPVMVDDLNMTLQFSCHHYIVLCGVTLIALRNAATEIVHRRHIQTTQGTTLKRTLQDCTGHIHTTMTQGTTEEGGIVTWRVSRSAAGRKSMMIYVSPISSKTLRGASASSCSRSACSMAFSTFFLEVSWASPPSRNSSRMK